MVVIRVMMMMMMVITVTVMVAVGMTMLTMIVTTALVIWLSSVAARVSLSEENLG